jgi:hypothetical protein
MDSDLVEQQIKEGYVHGFDVKKGFVRSPSHPLAVCGNGEVQLTIVTTGKHFVNRNTSSDQLIAFESKLTIYRHKVCEAHNVADGNIEFLLNILFR